MRSVVVWVIGAFSSPLGIVVLAALDSTIFFSLPFGIDGAVIIAAANHPTLRWLVPLLATAGSVAGAGVSFWMGAKMGEAGLDRHVSRRRFQRVRRTLKTRGAVALAVLDLIPPPFPFTPFVLAAGALDVDVATMFITLTVCRLLRFGLEAAFAARYGASILGWIESNTFREIAGICLALALIVSAVTILQFTRSRRRHPRAAA